MAGVMRKWGASHAIGYNLITRLPLIAREAGKCSPEVCPGRKGKCFGEQLAIFASAIRRLIQAHVRVVLLV